MQELFNVVLPVFVIIGMGYVANWRRFLDDFLFDGLMKFAQQFAVPCLLFVAISTLDLNASFRPSLLISFYSGALVCFVIGTLGAKTIFGRSTEDSIAIGFCALFSNTVMLGLPIAERAYGVDNLSANFAIVAIHSLFCYLLGISVMELSRARGKSVVSAFQTVAQGLMRNVLVLAILAGFVMNLSGLQLPSPIMDGLSLLARSALPVALFAIGGVLYRYKPEGDSRVIAFVCTLSLVVHPTIALAVGTLLELSQANLRAAVIMASVAPGVNTYLFASLYGRAMRVAASSVLFGTLLSILSVSVWLVILS